MNFDSKGGALRQSVINIWYEYYEYGRSRRIKRFMDESLMCNDDKKDSERNVHTADIMIRYIYLQKMRELFVYSSHAN